MDLSSDKVGWICKVNIQTPALMNEWENNWICQLDNT